MLDLTNTLIRTLDGTIQYWSLGNEKLYGWSANEAVGMSSHRLFNTSFPEPLQAINASLESHGDWSGNLLHHDRNGRVLNVLSHWVLNKQDTTAPGTVVEVSVPASGSQPYLTSIIESSNDAVIGETLDANVISWNPSAERLFEYTAAEMMGSPS